MSQFTMLTTFSKTERPFTAIMLKAVEELDAQYKNFLYLGAGEYGSVFSAFRKVDNQRVALKISQSNLASLQNQWRILKILEGVNGVPIVYKMLVTRENIGCLEMELLTLPLKEFLVKYRPPQSELYRMSYELIGILEEIHRRSILHRDIKPQNIMIKNPAANPSLYLIDFGLSEIIGESETKASFVGTLRFCSIKAHTLRASAANEGPPSSDQKLEPADDLESALYSMAYFVKNTLPWLKHEDDNSNITQKKNQDIMFSKMTEFGGGVGPVFSKAMKELLRVAKENKKKIWEAVRMALYDEEKENPIFHENELESVSQKVVQLTYSVQAPK